MRFAVNDSLELPCLGKVSASFTSSTKHNGSKSTKVFEGRMDRPAFFFSPCSVPTSSVQYPVSSVQCPVSTPPNLENPPPFAGGSRQRQRSGHRCRPLTMATGSTPSTPIIDDGGPHCFRFSQSPPLPAGRKGNVNSTLLVLTVVSILHSLYSSILDTAEYGKQPCPLISYRSHRLPSNAYLLACIPYHHFGCYHLLTVRSTSSETCYKLSYCKLYDNGRRVAYVSLYF